MPRKSIDKVTGRPKDFYERGKAMFDAAPNEYRKPIETAPKIPRKEELQKRASLYANGMFFDGTSRTHVALTWSDGYKAAMSDLRKIIDAVPSNGESEMIVVRKFLQPIR